MKILIRLLRGFANVWFVLAGLFIVVNLILVWYYEGFSRVQEIMSPFNIWNFIVVMITVAPGFGAVLLADHLERGELLEKPKSSKASQSQNSKITLDANILDTDKFELIEKAQRLKFDVALTTVTERERQRPDLIKNIKIIPEILVTDEGPLNVGALGSDDDAKNFENLLRTISNGSFPAKGKRDNLTSGEKKQLRDAIAFTSHVRDARDIFVTDDRKGFINDGRRKYIETTYPTKVMTTSEFRDYLAKVEQENA